MAINVNNVYRTVLAVLNKEQRGYLTPDQFNRLGRQAQLELFEKSFYDYNRAATKQARLGTNREYGDIAGNIKEKIDVFATKVQLTPAAGVVTEPNTLYRLIGVFSENRLIEFEEVKKQEIPYLLSSKLNQPTTTYPIYYSEGDEIKILPTGYTDDVIIDFIKKPSDLSPTWAYTGGGAAAYAYDSNNSVDFELHESEETDLVIKILALSGVVIKDPTVIQVAQQKEINDFNQENA